MITGLKKWQKTTEIFFSEAKNPITISTFNTSLKNRLTEFAKEYHPPGSEFGKEKGRYKKQRDIALAL